MYDKNQKNQPLFCEKTIYDSVILYIVVYAHTRG